jgi:hypothetical protein
VIVGSKFQHQMAASAKSGRRPESPEGLLSGTKLQLISSFAILMFADDGFPL